MQRNNNKTPKEIGKEVSHFFKVNRITQKEAAERLGLASKQSVANLLGGKRFSASMAAKFEREFGIRPDFLIHGRGPVTGDGHEEDTAEELRTLRETVRIQAETIAFLTRKLTEGAKSSASRKYLRYIVFTEAGETATGDYREAFTMYQKASGRKSLKGLKNDGELKEIFKSRESTD